MAVFDLKIGFKCNNNCKHCVVADKRPAGDLDLDYILNLIPTIPAGTTVQITGGEPSFYKDRLPLILKTCKERKLFTVIQTNGTGFASEDFTEKCIPYLDHAHIAIHSSNPEIHDFIVGSSGGMWDLTIKGFKNLNKHNIHISTQTVLSKYNIDSLYDTFTMIQNLRPGTHMSMTYPHLMGNAYHNRDQVAFRYSDHKEIISKTLNKYAELIFVESIPPCYLYPYNNRIMATAEKDLYNQVESRVGLDFSQGFDNINYNYMDLINRKKGPKCKDCIFNNKCVGVWKEYIETFKHNLDLYPIKEDTYDINNK